MVRRARARATAPGTTRTCRRAIVAMLNQFCYMQLVGATSAGEPDDDACIPTLANIFYRAIYCKGGTD